MVGCVRRAATVCLVSCLLWIVIIYTLLLFHPPPSEPQHGLPPPPPQAPDMAITMQLEAAMAGTDPLPLRRSLVAARALSQQGGPTLPPSLLALAVQRLVDLTDPIPDMPQPAPPPPPAVVVALPPALRVSAPQPLPAVVQEPPPAVAPVATAQVTGQVVGCSEVRGKDIIGADVQDHPVTLIVTPNDCCAACRGNPSCQAWSYLQSEHLCYLKRNDLGGYRDNLEIISGKLQDQQYGAGPPPVPLPLAALPAVGPPPPVVAPEGRLGAVKEAMQFAWKGYRTHAWGSDEYHPTSGRGEPGKWGAIGMNIVDSLDTLKVMGLDSELKEAEQWVRTTLRFETSTGSVSHFETTIRALGGLLGAYATTGEEIYKEKARDIGNRLSGAMDTPLGLPCKQVTLASPSSQCGGSLMLSEIGTVQLELRYLSQITGDPSFAQRANKIYAWAYRSPAAQSGMFGTFVDANSGSTSGEVSYGGGGDSFFEYLLKGWIQGGRREGKLRELYDKAVQGLTSNLLGTTQDGLTYIGTSAERGKMEHLACFVPGMLALGAHTAQSDAASQAAANQQLDLAKALMLTCYEMYRRNPTGLAPERVIFSPQTSSFTIPDDAAWTVLRPETLESLYVLFMVTKNPQYQEWGWNIFLAIQKFCKTTYGFGAHPDVRRPERPCCQGADDRTETFFFAETMKYMYLLLEGGKGKINLDSYVFNTEAHPLVVSSPDAAPPFPLFE